MKQISKLLLIAVLIGLMTPSFAQVSKEKTIQKNFPLQGVRTLSIDSKFGTIHINTGNVSQIQMKVTLIAKAKNTERAEKLLNTLNVEIEQGSIIRLKTTQGNTNSPKVLIPSFTQGGNTNSNNTKMSNNESFEVNYLITMPENIALDLENKFGSIYLANHRAALNINLGYGSLKAEKLSGEEQKNIQVSFGSANIDFLENANVEVSYSDLKLQEGKSIDFSGKYGNCEITKVHQITGSSSFSKFLIGTLTGKLQMYSKHDGEFQIKQVKAGFSGIDLEASFTQLSIGFEANTSFKFDVDVKFSELKIDQKLYTITSKEEQKTSAHYAGHKGTQARAMVKIESKYGDVKFK